VLRKFGNFYWKYTEVPRIASRGGFGWTMSLVEVIKGPRFRADVL
jgi:hypothetical protein